MRPVLLLLAAALPLAAAETSPPGTNAAQIKKLYDDAFRYFSASHYSRAIQEWSAVLKLDPAQKTAGQMIRAARERIDARDKAEQAKVFRHVSAGRYQKGLVELQVLLDRDPLHPLYQTLQERLQRVSEIVPAAPARDRAWKAAVTGLGGYIARKEDLQLAYNGLRYARELDGKERRFERLIELVTAARPELTAEKVTPGMPLLEYKGIVALNQIYDGKYHLAVDVLNQILALEPNDIVSLKRLGSAYYSLGRYAQARQAWKRALQLDPRDASLKRFLAEADKKAKK